MLGYYGTALGEKNAEVLAMASARAGKQAISCRPADLLQPEWEQRRAAATALPGFGGTDEDVLTYAMFPKIAPQFFKTRTEGPKQLGDEPATADSERSDANLATGTSDFASDLRRDPKWQGTQSHRSTSGEVATDMKACFGRLKRAREAEMATPTLKPASAHHGRANQ